MGYGHGPNLLTTAKPAFVTETRVVYQTRDGRWVPGIVMGPDQDYFPSPAEVFVSFPCTGLTRQVPVGDLEPVKGAGE